MRRYVYLFLMIPIGLAMSAQAASAETPYRQRVERDFQAWLAGDLRAAARAAGISNATVERTLKGVTLDWELPNLRPPGVERGRAEIAWQAEFGSPSAYFGKKRLGNLAAHGQRRLAKWSDTLSKIEARYGVPAEVLVAVWGRESSFGDIRLPENAIRAIATQAFMGRRKTMYDDELVAALRIIQEGDITVAGMRSSWAGAMGQPQFLPTLFHHYAVDFDGDGRRDIWGSVPDSLASIANFLRQEGWRPERGWGLEVRLPASVACTLAGPKQGRPMVEWAEHGVTTADGSALPVRPGRDGFLFLPAGRGGPVFIVTENFYTLKHYNFSDNYALYIGHLSDRMKGQSGFAGSWASTEGITRGDIRRLQESLEAAGYDVGGADGLVGYRTRIAIGQWQAAAGRTPTCFPNRALIADLD
ncbi:MAG: lytic murein transglycosylase [Alphaproteobacteria bacterium]